MESKNFNVSTTASSPLEYSKFIIIQRKNDLDEAWESYSKVKHAGTQSSLNIVTARTISLILSQYGYFERKINKERLEAINKILFNEHEPTEKELREILFDIARLLDKDRLTRFDTKNTYDGTRAELENKEHGN